MSYTNYFSYFVSRTSESLTWMQNFHLNETFLLWSDEPRYLLKQANHNKVLFYISLCLCHCARVSSTWLSWFLFLILRFQRVLILIWHSKILSFGCIYFVNSSTIYLFVIFRLIILLKAFTKSSAGESVSTKEGDLGVQSEKDLFRRTSTYILNITRYS